MTVKKNMHKENENIEKLRRKEKYKEKDLKELSHVLWG